MSTIKVKAPKGMTSFSHGGIRYEVGADGTVEVPDHALPELLAHGLTRHVEKSAEEPRLEAKVTSLPELRKERSR